MRNNVISAAGTSRCGVLILCALISTVALAKSRSHEVDAPISLLEKIPSPLASPTSGPAPSVKAILPLSFEKNEGQTDPAVQFVAHGEGYEVFLTDKQAVIALREQAIASDDPMLDKMSARKRGLFMSRKSYRGSPRNRRHTKDRVIRFSPANASGEAQPIPENQLPGNANYFVGRDPSNWKSGISTFRRVRYPSIYPGIDLLYYGNQRQLEFDFVVSPSADPDQIALKVETSGRLKISKAGEVAIVGEGYTAPVLRKPKIYQVVAGRRVEIAGHFVLRSRDEIGFKVDEYDRELPLTIDPTLSYSTYLGGNGTDDGFGVAVDSSGNAYVVGQTTSTNFPTANAYSMSSDASGIAFVSKLDPTGSTLLYSTYLGGTGGEVGNGIALDSKGNVYVTGYTLSSDFPVVNGFQSATGTTSANAFVARLDTNQTGAASLVYSTYLGGGGNSTNPIGDVGFAVAVDGDGLAYVTGQTTSDSSVSPFPTTGDAFQSSLQSTSGNAFLTVIDTTKSGASSLVYSTYLGGSSVGFGDFGLGVAINSAGVAFVTGSSTSLSPSPFPTTAGGFQTSAADAYGNAFLAAISPFQSGTASLLYSSYLGGTGDSSDGTGDVGLAIATDSSDLVYVTGNTSSSDFPTTSGAFQTTSSGSPAFVSKFDTSQSGAASLIYSTYLGGSGGDEGRGIAVDVNGYAFVGGATASGDFPTTSGALQASLVSTSSDGFISRLNPTGTALGYATYLGGSCASGDSINSIGLDFQGNSYVAGDTCSTDFPTEPSGALQTALGGSQNAFVTKLALTSTPAIAATVGPVPNSSGWNNSPATVSFTCLPGAVPVVSCTSPTTVSIEGANQNVTGTVVDASSTSENYTQVVSLDLTPPVITVSSPTNGATVTSPYVTITGTVTDTLSGPSVVLCGGIPASLTGTTFSCTISLSVVSNPVEIRATDVAGNAVMTSLSLTLGLSTPASLQVSPASAQIAVGDTQSFIAVDQLGTNRPDATWSISDPTVATLASGGSGILTAQAAGTATLTATIGGVSATTPITVIGSSFSVGDVIWSAPSVSGFTPQQIIQAIPTTNGPDLYSIETDSSNDVLARAFKANGTQLWQTSVSSLSGGYEYALGDSQGGLIVGSATQIVDISPVTGSQLWTYAASGMLSSSLATGTDGSVYVVEMASDRSVAYLDKIDGTDGTLTSQIALPTSSSWTYNFDCFPGQNSGESFPGNFGSPFVGVDGTVAIEVESYAESQTYLPCGGDGGSTTAYAENLSLMQVTSSGTASYQTLNSNSSTTFGATPFSIPGDAVPDGNGGWLASWAKSTRPDGTYFGYYASLSDIGSSGISEADLTGVDYGGPTSLIVGDAGTAFMTDAVRVVSISPATLAQNWSYTSTGGTLSFSAATEDAGVAVEDSSLGLILIDSSGSAQSPVAGFSIWEPWSSAAWPMISAGSLSFVYGPDAKVVEKNEPLPRGNRSASRSVQLPTLIHYVTVDPGSSYSAAQFPKDLAAFLPDSKAHNQYRLLEQATLQSFINDLKSPAQAVGFIGHALLNGEHGPAVGVCLYDQCLEKAGVGVTDPNTHHPAPRQYTSVPTNVPVLFFGTCKASTTFTSLWGVSGSSTSRALITPSAGSFIGLTVGAIAWKFTASYLGTGYTVDAATKAGNDGISNKYAGYTWSAIGAHTLKIANQ